MRQEVANRYNEKLNGFVKTPFVKDHNVSAWAQYSILHADREKIMAGLKAKGIPTAIYYPKPLHLQDAFVNLNYRMGDLPVTESVAKEVFSLPMHPYLSESDQDQIVEAIIQIVK